MLKKFTRYLVSKNKDIQTEFVKDYLDKKVISIRIDEFNQPEKGGERIHLENVILHNSIINNSIIETEGLTALGNYVTFSNNIIKTKEK